MVSALTPASVLSEGVLSGFTGAPPKPRNRLMNSWLMSKPGL